MAAEDPARSPDEGGSAAPAGRQRRSVRWIVTTVLVSVILIAGLGLWVATSSTEVKINGRPIDCDALVTWGTGPAADAKATTFERSCDHQRDKRRTTALLFGVGIATVAAAVSTVPSRRLTGEALGPTP